MVINKSVIHHKNVLLITVKNSVVRAFALILSLTFYQPVFSQETSCWPNYRGDSQLLGVSHSNIPDNPVLLWNFKIPDQIKAPPVVCSNVIVVGSVDGNVYGFSLKGKMLWKINTGNSIEAPALILNNRAYIGNLGGELFCIEISTGKILWTYKTENQIMGAPNYYSAGAQSTIIVGSYDYYLHGINAETGKGKWKYEADNFINGTPAVSNNLAVFGGCDGLLHLVNAENGILHKRIEVASYIAGSAAVENNVAYIGDYDGKFSCIDLNTMNVVWEFSEETVQQPFIASPSITTDAVIIGSRDKYLYSFNKKNGALNWKINTGGKLDASPVVVNNKILAANMRGDLLILEAIDGKILWSYELGSPVLGNPAVINNYIIVGAADGRLYCFGKK